MSRILFSRRKVHLWQFAWYLSSTNSSNCLQAINVEDIIILRYMIKILCPCKYSCVFTNRCTRRYKIPRPYSPPFLWCPKYLLAKDNISDMNHLKSNSSIIIGKKSWNIVAKFNIQTSSRYLIPLWEVRFTQPGPQPQLGPHS